MTSTLRRVLRLGMLSLTRPGEFRDRVAVLADRLMDRREAPRTTPLQPEALWPFISSVLRISSTAIRQERELAEVDAYLIAQNKALPVNAPFGTENSAETFLGHAAYVLCRALRPAVVVETGVAYGSMTTYILSALHVNGRGTLHSIDLPSILDHDALMVGRFVPEDLRNEWCLHLGCSRRRLPELLRCVGPIGLFAHDSLHTKRNMSWELATVTPHMAPGAAVLSDDVHENRAFEDWAQGTAARWALVRQLERNGWLGIAVLHGDR